MFDSRNAYQHAEFLSIPRAVGSDGEKAAKAYCIDTLERLGIRAQEQPFTFTTLPDALTRVLPFIFGAILWTVVLLHARPSWIATSILVCTAAVGMPAALFRLPLKKLYTLPGKLKSANVIGHIAARSEARRHLIFMAHYDSKSQVLPIAVRSACFAGLLLCYAMAIVSHPLSYYWSDSVYRAIVSICGNGAMLFGVLLLVNVVRNRSPGAADNACGAAIVLELARVFAEQPLRHVHLSFLLTGAEEYGMAGAFKYMMEKPALAPDARFINIDGVGRANPIRLIGRGEKFGCPEDSLVKGLTSAARKTSLKVSETGEVPGIGFDHVAMTGYGYPAVTLSAGDLSMLLRIHSPRDGIDWIEPLALDGIGTLCETYAGELDRSLER